MIFPIEVTEASSMAGFFRMFEAGFPGFPQDNLLRAKKKNSYRNLNLEIRVEGDFLRILGRSHPR
jgi:hypothetical protein